MPSVEATVTTRPRACSSAGRAARTTAAAMARPRPDEPPVTMTVPGLVSGTGEGLLDQSRGGAAGHVGHDHGAAAPAGERRRLGQVRGGVVAALGPDVGPQLGEDGTPVALLEDDDGVDAAQRSEHGGAVSLRDERPVGALEAGDGRVGGQADDEAVAERTPPLQRADVARVEEG